MTENTIDDITVPDISTGLDNTNLNLNKGLETINDNWLKPESFSKPIDMRINMPQLVGNTAKEPDLLTDISNLTGAINATSGKRDVRENQFISKADVPDDFSRYPTYYQGIDNEERYGNQQGGLTRAAIGIVEGLSTAARTTLEGTLGLVYDTGAMISGGSFIDNDFNKSMKMWSEGLEKTLPRYVPKVETEESLLNPKHWFRGNTLAGLFNTIGFIGGMWLPGRAAGALIGGIAGIESGGVSLGSKLSGSVAYRETVQNLAKTTKILGEIPEGSQFASQIASEVSRVKTLEDASAVTKKWADAAEKYATQAGIYQKGSSIATHVVSNLGMASAMGHEAREGFVQNMYDQVRSEENREPTDEEKARIEDMSKSVGNWTTGLVTLVSAVSFSGIFGNLLNKDGADALVRESIDDIAIKGEKGQLALKGNPNLGTGEVEYQAKKFTPTASSKTGQFGQKAWNTTKVWAGKARPFINPAAGLGMMEFSLIQPTVEDYYNKKFQGNEDALPDAVGTNLSAMFTKEGLGTFLTGMLAPLPFEVARKFSERKTTRTNTTAAAKAFTDNYLGGYLQSLNHSVTRGEALSQEEVQATVDNDKGTVQDKKREQLENYLYPRIRYGQKWLVDQDIQGFRETAGTADGIKKLQEQGIIPKDGNLLDLKETFSKHLDKLQKAADNAEKYYKAITLEYGSYRDSNGQRVFDNGQVEKMLYLSGMTDDASARVKGLAEELSTSEIGDIPRGTEQLAKMVLALTKQDITGAAIRTGEVPTNAKSLYLELEKGIKNLQLTDDKKADLLTKLQDIINLQAKKSSYIGEYNDIIKNPEQYADKVTETPLAGTAEDTAKEAREVVVKAVKTRNRDIDFEKGEIYVSGEKIQPGKVGNELKGSYRDFMEFKVLGEEVDDTKDTNKRQIRIGYDFDKEGNPTKEQLIDEGVFSRYKVGKLSDMQKHPGASYWYRNRNREYTLNTGGKLKTGRLEYDSDTESLFFREHNSNYREKVTRDDLQDKTITSVTDKGTTVYAKEARLKPRGEISKADKEFIDAKKTERELAEHQKHVEGKLEVISKLQDKKVELLIKAEDELADHKVRLEDAQKKLADVHTEIESMKTGEDITPAKRTNSFKKGMRTLFTTAGDLSKIISSSEDRIRELSATVEDLNRTIADLDSVMHNVEELPDGLGIQQFYRDNKKTLEDSAVDIGVKINTFSKFINDVKEALQSVINSILDRIGLFERKYDKVPYNDDNSLRKFLNDRIADKEFFVGTDVPSWFDSNPRFFDDLKNLKEIVTTAEEADIPIKQSQINDAQEQITKLYDQLSDIDRALKLNNELYDAFQQRYKEWIKERNKQRVLQKDGKTNLEKVGNQMNPGESVIITGTDIPQAVKSVFEPLKAIDILPLSSIGADTRSFESQNSQSFNNWMDRFSSFATAINTVPGNTDPKNPVYAQRATMKVMVLTRDKVDQVFGEGKVFKPLTKELIEHQYQVGGETVHNGGKELNRDKAAVVMLLVNEHTDTDGKQVLSLVDKAGKLVQDSNPDNFVFTKMETALSLDTDNKRATGHDKYHIPEGVDEQEVIKRSQQFRTQFFDSAEPAYRMYDFTVSGGVPNVARGADGKIIRQYNSVVTVNLLPKDSYKGSIFISKRIANTEQRGGVNISIPVGYPVLKHGDNLVYLNARQFNSNDAEHIYRVIKAFSRDYIEKGGKTHIDTNPLMRYLASILYWKQPEGGSKLAINQLYLDADKFELVFDLAGKEQRIRFTPDDLAIEDNKQALINFLDGSYHQINAKTVDSKLPFEEITSVDSSGAYKTKVWPSYEQYLLSPEGRSEGQNSEISYTVDIQTGDKPPLLNKYITIQDTEQVFTRTKKELPVEDVKPELVADNKELKPDNGKKVAFKVQDTKSGISKSFSAVADGVTVNTYNVTGTKDHTYTLAIDDKGTFTATVVDGSAATVKQVEARLNKMPLVERKAIAEAKSEEPIKQEVKEPAITPTDPVTVTREQKAESVDEVKQMMKDRELAMKDMTTNPSDTGELVDFAQVSPLDRYTDTVNIPDFREFLKATMPQIELRDIPRIIKEGNISAYGKYEKHYIQLWQDAPAGTDYHEAYHAVEDSFLTDKELVDIRKEFRDRPLSYTDRFGKVIDYSKATEQQVRERMAEEFRQFKNENPRYQKSSRITNFFRKLLNFIKHFVFGKPETIQEVFKKINSSYYRHMDFVRDSEGAPQYAKMKDFSVRERKVVIDGIAEKIIKNLRANFGALVRNIEEPQTFKDLVQPAFEEMKQFFRDPVIKGGLIDLQQRDLSKLSTEDQKQARINASADALTLWKKIANKGETAFRNEVMDDLRMFFRKHKVIFKEDKSAVVREMADDEVNAQEKEVNIEYWDERSDRDYAHDILVIDAKRNAPVEIKLLFSFLTRTDGKNPNLGIPDSYDLQLPQQARSELMQPELADSNQYFYRVMDELGDSAGLFDMERKLRTMAKKDPVMVRLYKSVFPPKSSQNIDSWKLQFKFLKTFSKQQPDYLQLRKDENGEVYTVNSNFDSNVRDMVKKWEYDIRGNSAISSANGNRYTIDPKKIKGVPKDNSSTVAFLKEINVPVADDIMLRLSEPDRKALNIQANKVYELVQTNKGSIKVAGKDAMELSTPLNRIAEILVKNQMEYTSSGHLNMDGNNVQNNILNNTMSRMMAAYNTVGSLGELYKLFPEYQTDAWSKNSVLLSKGGPLFDEQGKSRGIKLSNIIVEGLHNEDNDYNPKTSTGDMNTAVRGLTMLNFNLDGVWYSLIPADSNTEWAMRMGHYITKEQFKGNNYKKPFNDIMIGYLTDEINCAKDYISGKRIKTQRGQIDGNKLQLFKDILPEQLVKQLQNHIDNEPLSDTTEFLKDKRKAITDAVQDHINKVIAADKDFFQSWKILEPFMERSQTEFVDNDPAKEFAVVNKKIEGEPINKFYGLLSDLPRSLGYTYTDNGQTVYTEGQVDNILRFRAMNILIHNVELKKAFWGPFNEMADDVKRNKNFLSGTESTYTDDNNIEGFNRWANNELNKVQGATLKQGDLGYHAFSDTWPVLTVDHDRGVVSAMVEELKAAGIPNADKYSKIEEMDAQGIMLDTYWREMKYKWGGEFTAADEAQHQYDMAVARDNDPNKDRKSRLSKEVVEQDKAVIDKGDPQNRLIGNIQKPLYAGVVDMEGQNIPVQLKTSVMRLSYPLAKDLGLEKLYWYMHDNAIGAIGPKSWQKTGQLYNEAIAEQNKDKQAGLPRLYQHVDGKWEFGLDKYPQEAVKAVTMQLNWKNMNKIVETAKSSTGQTMGSQLRKIAILNTFVRGLPADFYNADKDDWQTSNDKWHKLSEADKQKISPRYKLYKQADRAISEITSRGLDNAIEQLGITADGNNYKLTNPYKVQELLVNAAMRGEVPDNIASAIQVQYDFDSKSDKLVYPLEALPNFEDLRSAIWSVVDKNIMRPKLNGAPYTIVSPALWEKNGREAMYKDAKGTWKPVTDWKELSKAEQANVMLTSSELKFYTQGTEGTTKMQVKIGNPFRKQLEQWAERNSGKIIPSDKELLKFLNTQNGKKLLQIIGFRIPTQGFNSIDSAEIVEFLHPSMGDAIVVPSELVTKAGIDFDYDKMNVYHPNFWIDDKGMPHYIEFIEDTSFDEALAKIYKASYSNKQRKDITVSRAISAIFDKEGVGEDIPTFEEFKAKFRDEKDPYKVNSYEAVQNRYFETLHDIILHSDNYKQLLTPNSTDQMEAVEADINKLLYPNIAKRDKDNINYLQLTDPLYMVTERQNYIEAKGDMIGISAQNNTFHALAQTQMFTVEKGDFVPKNQQEEQVLGDYKIYLPHNKVKVDGQMKTTYSGGQDRMGNWISDKISQYINGAVDAVKNTWLIRLLKNKSMMGTALFLERMGADPKFIMTFLNQPAVQEFTKQETIQKSVRGINDTIRYKSPEQIAAEVREQYYREGVKGEVEPVISNFDLTDLTEVLRRTGKKENLNNDQKKLQVQVLNEYLKYRVLADHSLKDQLALMWDNMRGVNDRSVDIKQARVAHARDRSSLGIADKIMNSTFQGHISDTLDKAVQAITDTLMPISSNPALDQIKSTFYDMDKAVKGGDFKRQQIIGKAALSLVDYALQTGLKSEDTAKLIKELLIDNTTATANELTKLRNSAKGDLKTLLTKTLKFLQPVRDLDTKGVKGIKLAKKPEGVFESDQYTEALRELRDYNVVSNDLYNRLITTGLLQSGLKNSKISYNDLIPYEDYLAALKPVIDKIHQGIDLSPFADNYAMYRNEYFNKDIVPAVAKKSAKLLTIKTPGYQAVAERLLGQGEQLANSRGLKAPVYLSMTSKSNNSRYPVLRITDIATNPDTGEQYKKSEIAKLQADPDNNIQYFRTRLFQKVLDSEGKPIISGMWGDSPSYLYKQINAWGDGNRMQEYYDHPRESVLPHHEKVMEVPDKAIEAVFNGRNLEVYTTRPQRAELSEQGNVPLQRVMKFTPEKIETLMPDQVFVFSSNSEGVHGKGAALLAKQKFGAIQGQAEGLQGQSYAVITKKNWRVEKSSTLQEIGKGLQDMLIFAKEHLDKEFLVTKLGSSLAGYTIPEIKGLFEKLKSYIPDNVILPKDYEVRDTKSTWSDIAGKRAEITEKPLDTKTLEAIGKVYTAKDIDKVLKDINAKRDC